MIDSFNRLSLRERILVSMAVLLSVVIVYVSAFDPSRQTARLSLAEQSLHVDGAANGAVGATVDHASVHTSDQGAGGAIAVSLTKNSAVSAKDVFDNQRAAVAIANLAKHPLFANVTHLEFLGTTAYAQDSEWYKHLVQLKLDVDVDQLDDLFKYLASSRSWQIERMAWWRLPQTNDVSLSSDLIREDSLISPQTVSVDVVVGLVNLEPIWLSGKGRNNES